MPPRCAARWELACARLGLETVLMTLNLESIALMPCNPSIGGTGKGHLVREVDALGGEMGLAADDALIQGRMLNTGKGPAVRSLRAQEDKRAYHLRMMQALFAQEHLEIMQAEADEILTENDIPHAIAQSWEEVLADPQARANDVFYEMEYPGATRSLVRQPVFVGSELPEYNRAPLLGEQSEEILRELGYSDEELSQMHAAGIYATWDDLKGKHNG